MTYLIIAFGLLCTGAIVLIKMAADEVALASHEMIEVCQHIAEMYGQISRKGGNSFMCYYCQERFPMAQQEVIGKYYFCLEHGTIRKERLLKEECGVSQS